MATPGRTSRFRMLETIKQYARERLNDAELGRRHAYYYAAVAERAEESLRGPDQSEWLARLRLEQGNLRAALEWALGGRPPSLETSATRGSSIAAVATVPRWRPGSDPCDGS